MPRRASLTMRDLAGIAGVHHTTVSRALRRHPEISSAQQDRILGLAHKHGYRISPLVSAYMSHRKRTRVITTDTTLGYLTNHPAHSPWQRCETFVQNYTGAVRQAAQRGYRLEEFSLAEAGLTPRRLTQILRTRNIRGIIVAPLSAAHTRIELEWSHFCAVAIGFTMEDPPLLHVANDHYHTMQLALRECRRHGSSRPGLTLSHSSNERVDGRWLAAYLHDQRAHPAKLHPALFDPEAKDGFDLNAFHRWFSRETPDVILGLPFTSAEHWAKARSLLPPDVGWVNLDVLNPDGQEAGVHQDHQQIGAAAVDQLISLIERNQTGPLKATQSLLLDGTWVEGKSIGRRSEKSSDRQAVAQF